MVADDVDGPRWQTKITSFEEGLAHICQSKEFADVRFIVGTRTFKAHRLILCARSTAFARMLLKPEKTLMPMANVEIHDVPEEAFNIIINFIYTDAIPEMPTLELTLDVFYAAMKYNQTKLFDSCKDLILDWQITLDTVIPMWQMSKLDLPMLKLRCWRYLNENSREVLLTDRVLVDTELTMAQMLETRIIKKFTKLEVLDITVRWAVGKNCHKKDDYETARKHLLVPIASSSKCLMKCLGFESFSTEELGQVIAKYPKLLTDAEVRMLFIYVCSEGDNKPELPEW